MSLAFISSRFCAQNIEHVSGISCFKNITVKRGRYYFTLLSTMKINTLQVVHDGLLSLVHE